MSTIRDHLADGPSIGRLATGVAGTDLAGKPTDVRGPMVDERRNVALWAGEDPQNLVRAFVGITSIFGEDLRNEPVFPQAVTDALGNLSNKTAGSQHARPTTLQPYSP